MCIDVCVAGDHRARELHFHMYTGVWHSRVGDYCHVLPGHAAKDGYKHVHGHLKRHVHGHVHERVCRPVVATDMHIDMYIDMCIDMCIDMYIDMCTNLWYVTARQPGYNAPGGTSATRCLASLPCGIPFSISYIMPCTIPCVQHRFTMHATHMCHICDLHMTSVQSGVIQRSMQYICNGYINTMYCMYKHNVHGA